MDTLNIQCRCGCGRIKRTRGLSNRCYQRYQRMVKARETTWEKLEQEGKVDPRKPRPADPMKLF